MGRPLTAVVVAVIMAVSVVAASGGAVTATPGSGADGHVGVPTDRVVIGPPDPVLGGLDGLPVGVPDGPQVTNGLPSNVPQHAAAWRVTSSRHAGDLSARIGTDSAGRLVVVLTDDVNHAGREIALNASAVEQVVGHQPGLVYGTHEDGTTWTAPVTYENGVAVFDVPHFSTNSVTFTSEVNVTGSQAVDGSTVGTYDVANGSLDSVSTPNVTLTGVDSTEVDTVSGANIGNGGSVALDVAGTKAATDASVTFTGTGFGERWDNYSATGVGLSHSKTLGVDGAQQPTDGAGGDPTVSVTAHGGIFSGNPYDDNGATKTSATGVGDTGTDGLNHIEVRFEPSNDGILTDVSPYIGETAGGDYGFLVDVYIVPEAPDGAFGEGTLIKSGWDPSFSLGFQSIDVSAAGYSVTAGQTYTIEFVTQSTNSDGVEDQAQFTYGGSPATTWFRSAQWGAKDAYGRMDYTIEQKVQNLEISDDTGKSYTFGNFTDGQTKTGTLDLRGSSTSLSFSGTGGGTIDYNLTMRERDYTDSPSIDVDGDGVNDAAHTGMLTNGETATYALPDLALTDDTGTVSLTTPSAPTDVSVSYTEHTESVDPAVGLNGNQMAYTGTLAPGATTTLTGNSSWVIEGTNSVDATVSTTASADAPVGKVGVAFNHTIDTAQSTDYAGEKWSESYNVSRTWASDRDAAVLTIPFDSASVYSVRSVTLYQNGTEVTPQSTSFDGSTLVVEIGSVQAGTETRVEAAGSKVVTSNGNITVLEGTLPGDKLATKIRVDDAGEGFSIGVGGTVDGDRVHYADAESWSSPADFSRISASGTQGLHLPNAGAGSTARIKAMNLEVSPGAGTVEVVATDPLNPRFRIRPAPNSDPSDVTVTWNDATGGVTYSLYKLVDGDREAVDTQTANSPVSFLTSAASTLYEIGESEDTGGKQQGAGVNATQGGVSAIDLLTVIGGTVGAVLVFWFVGRRYAGARGLRQNTVLLVGGTVTGLVGVSMATGTSALSFVPAELTVMLSGIGIMLGLYLLDSKTGIPVPNWLYLLGGGVVTVWLIETILPGALSSGLAEVSTLLWIIGAIGVIVLLYRRMKGPTILIGGEKQ